MKKQGFWQKYGWIVRNIALAAALILCVTFIASIALRYGTQHGKEVEVPDFTNMVESEAEAAAQAAGVRVQVTDSVYINRMRRNAVSHQYPSAGSRVKRGRVIDLTINSRLPRRVAMPSLVGLSTQQAISELKSRGLEAGWLEYSSDIATNNVKGQRYRNQDIKPGTMVRAGSRITLVIGLNASDDRTYVPDVRGRKLNRAMEMIHDRYLNVGTVSYDNSVRNFNDSLSAVVYKQIPASDEQARIMGTQIRLWLTTDPDKMD